VALEKPVIAEGEFIVTRRLDQVEPLAVAPAMRGAFETADNEASKQANI
jgi:hypothetical protein